MAEKRKRITRDSRYWRTDRVKNREKQEILRLRNAGLGIKEIADKLRRRPQTIKKHLDFMSKISQQVAIQEVSHKLVPDIEKLAKRIQQLTKVPLPTKPFLPENKEDEKRIVNNLMSGNSHLFISVLTAQPWWCITGSIDLRRYLSARDEALLDLLLNLPVSKKLKSLLEEWQQKANTYLSLKQANSDADTINRARDQAEQITNMLHAELWEVVVNLSIKTTR
jgi:DNA-binding transcriptional MerR regulator